MRADFDIVVVGGGLVGSCFAALAACTPELDDLRIAVVEARPPALPPPDDVVDLRVSAVSRASQRILTVAGAWSRIDSRCLSPYTDMVVWDHAGSADGEGAIHFSSAETAEPDLGHIVANDRLLWALMETPVIAGRVVWLPASLTGLDCGPDCTHVSLSDGRRYTVHLVVGADGGASASRQLAGIETSGWPYERQAVVAHVTTERPHRATAWQRFLPAGPLAFLPLADGRSSIVWTTTPEHAAELLEVPDAAFGAEIAAASDHVLGAVTARGPRAAFPLVLRHARHYCRQGFVLIGDAAHVVHPLAGQGVNLGFMDAAALVQILAEARAAGGGLSEMREMKALRRYERWRKSENLLAMGLIDVIGRVFASPDPAIAALRRIGLGAVRGSGFMRRVLVERALGLAGEVPRIVHGAN
jgi:2-polyprenylphenol 6-hydroxylase